MIEDPGVKTLTGSYLQTYPKNQNRIQPKYPDPNQHPLILEGFEDDVFLGEEDAPNNGVVKNIEGQDPERHNVEDKLFNGERSHQDCGEGGREEGQTPGRGIYI